MIRSGTPDSTAPANDRAAGRNAATYIATVAGEQHAIRGLTVWPIDEVLGAGGELDAVLSGMVPDAADGDAALDSDTLQDLLASRLIAPPRPRRRRDRSVSSRAVFYQPSATGAG